MTDAIIHQLQHEIAALRQSLDVPGQERREQLVRYLDRLAANVARHPLRGLDERLDRGDGIALHHVYVMLATESRSKP